MSQAVVKSVENTSLKKASSSINRTPHLIVGTRLSQHFQVSFLWSLALLLPPAFLPCDVDLTGIVLVCLEILTFDSD